MLHSWTSKTLFAICLWLFAIYSIIDLRIPLLVNFIDLSFGRYAITYHLTATI